MIRMLKMNCKDYQPLISSLGRRICLQVNCVSVSHMVRNKLEIFHLKQIVKYIFLFVCMFICLYKKIESVNVRVELGMLRAFSVL